MENIYIQQVEKHQTNELQNIGRQTFYETFSAVNAETNMNNYLAEAFSSQKIEAELNDQNTEFYFAKLENEIIGYLKLNFGAAQTELQDRKSLEIERIYVLNDYHGKKVGQLLYEKAIYIAKEIDVDFVWLGVWENNLRAINFYKKNGFVAFNKHLFKLGDDEQTDIMMKLTIKN